MSLADIKKQVLKKSAEKKEDTVTVKKSDLEKMVKEIAEKQIESLKKENTILRAEQKIGLGNWQEVEAKEKQNRTATFKLYRPTTDDPLGLVVDWKFLK